MNAARRFPWLPRFSIANVLMLMVVVGLCLAWYDQRRKLGEQADEIQRLRAEETRLAINNILRSEIPEATKGRLLAAYVTLVTGRRSLGLRTRD